MVSWKSGLFLGMRPVSHDFIFADECVILGYC
jgi:hypothetical protein